jgi:hypothetical protein
VKSLSRLHLTSDKPAEDISNSVEDVGFYVFNARQMTATGEAPNGNPHLETLPLFPVTFTKNIKPQEIHNLSSLNYIVIKVEYCGTQTGLTQFYNCQNFGHVWATCKQPPR